jgi:ribosomal protein L25 (general stress protein Ctc)
LHWYLSLLSKDAVFVGRLLRCSSVTAFSARFSCLVDKYMRRTAMTYEQRKQERQALIDHLLAQDWNVFGTLKFVNGRTVGRETANKILRSYWNKVDRVIYGKAAERQNMRLPRWCFAHEGSDHENFHVHFVLKADTPDTEHMCCLLNAVWAQHHDQTAPLVKNWIMPVQDRAAVASYVTHEYWRMGSDTILDELCWDAEQSDYAPNDNYCQQQAHRIQRAASPLWLRQAQQALDDQKARYEACGDLQMMERG